MRLSYACYGNSKTFANVVCDRRTKIEIHQVVFGSKASSTCPEVATVDTPLSCCVPECGECFKEDPTKVASVFAQTPCNGLNECTPRAQRTPITGCGTKPFTNYMAVLYECVPDSKPAIGPLSVTGNSTVTLDEILCQNAPSNVEISTQNVTQTPRMSTTTPMPVTRPTQPTAAAPVTEESVNLQGALVGGLAAGMGLLLLITIIVLVVVCCRRHNKHRGPPCANDISDINRMYSRYSNAGSHPCSRNPSFCNIDNDRMASMRSKMSHRSMSDCGDVAPGYCIQAAPTMQMPAYWGPPAPVFVQRAPSFRDIEDGGGGPIQIRDYHPKADDYDSGTLDKKRDGGHS